MIFTWEVRLSNGKKFTENGLSPNNMGLSPWQYVRRYCSDNDVFASYVSAIFPTGGKVTVKTGALYTVVNRVSGQINGPVPIDEARGFGFSHDGDENMTVMWFNEEGYQGQEEIPVSSMRVHSIPGLG